MKKLHLFAAIALLASVFVSCSKESLNYEVPYKADKSFLFSMEMGRSIPTSYGFEDMNNNTKWGPAMSIIQDNDPFRPSTTINVNNKYGIPKDMQGDLFFSFVLSKKGTDPTGQYDVLVTNGESSAHIIDNTTGRSYKIRQNSIMFNVMVVAKNTLFGKYAEGNYTMNVVDMNDTTKQIPVKGNFRLHIAE